MFNNESEKTVKVKSKNGMGAVLIILAGIFWGIISLFVRSLSEGGLDPMQISAVRLVTAAVILTAFTAIRSPGKLKFNIKDIWYFIGTGIISVVFFNCCYFSAIVNGEASIAVVLLYTSPIFIMLISRFVFKEKLTALKLTGLAATIGGCILVSGAVGSGHHITFPVFVTGIGSGLFYGLYTIFGKLALKKYDSLTVTVYTFVFGAFGSLPMCRAGDLVKCIAGSPQTVISCIIIGVLCTLLPYCMYTKGLESCEAGKASILVAVEPLVGAVIGMTILGESRDIAKIAGIVLILTAIVILNLPGKKKI